MALNKQIFCFSVDTSAFYEPDEQFYHERMLKLYRLRKKYKDKTNWGDKDLSWKKSAVNRVLAKEKETLSAILDKRADNREMRHLNQDVLNTKNTISLFTSSLTRAFKLSPNELTKDIIIVNVFFFQVFKNLVLDGFLIGDEKYIFLTASAGQIRQKKAVFVKKSIYDKVKGRLTCGLDIEDINYHGGVNPNKYCSYLALNNSATDVWEDFDIDKSIVVDDFETLVPGLVDYISDITYQIERKEMGVSIPHTDGCGMVLGEKTRMVRLPWVKGLLVNFPFDKFIQEKCGGEVTVCDIYGNEHKIIAEGIKYVFTKSQFKMAKYYNSWECYKEKFKHFGCEACYCNIEEDYIPKARINYQMLQTLTDMTDDEIAKLTKQTVNEIETIGSDYQTTMRLLGATDYNTDKSYFQEALTIYPELFKDQYSRDVLKQTKKSLVKQAKAGRLRVNGHYTFLSPDLYAFCEWLFLGEQDPKGLLEDGQVYCRDYRDGDELACLRSPHLYREWPIRNNVRNEELDKWFGMTKCVYTSCHDTISRILQFDVDGDKTLVIKDRALTKIAKRNMQNIVPLYYEMKKAKGGELSNQALYDGMTKAYTTGNIGPISNNITKIWNNGHVGQQEVDVVRWLCMENNFVIDAAKTLYIPTRPKEIDKIIKSYTKANVPYFFQYAKDKLPSQVEQVNESAMNRLSLSIPDRNIRYCKTIGRFDYRMLMKQDVGFDIQENSKIVERYKYYNTHQNYLFKAEDENHSNQEDLFMYQYIRNKIIEETGAELDYVVNTLVAYLYTVQKTGTKKMLWACFGDTIVANLKVNVSGKVCPICGRRFEPKRGNQDVYCSDECYAEGNRQKTRERKSLAVAISETVGAQGSGDFSAV
jgi:hypothetical protein